ncbi:MULTISPECIES: multidrug efflux SMR transporter [unclassified Pseudoalteromonas]|jgi:quaternary ammonium compound-resistance protein SugE|uniref:DMT family transporter n=1 Tax=unclassified Pseudoalteromonas TaxID=194690 RepID=UPI001023F336|nr:multidrug efflux SMR transporter [Pseudoalteromonas sp. L1]RZF93953.1 multidrug efflux SMR transporter [Pseudoalteromonas sp. CO302Y]RZG10928.1 multidrug efflux SMR transporter [Pseudoalteromonas sp. CO133X]WOC24796.1 multidrug efflux SMR transporter [Pseudoalteromonas sp. N1230-9]
MNWFLLIIAGLLEVAWAYGLKQSNGFSKPLVSFLTLLTMSASFYCLSLALKSLPLSLAYAVWVGIGVIGSALIGMTLLGEGVSLLKVLSLLFIAMGIIGLKVAS